MKISVRKFPIFFFFAERKLLLWTLHIAYILNIQIVRDILDSLNQQKNDGIKLLWQIRWEAGSRLK